RCAIGTLGHRNPNNLIAVLRGSCRSKANCPDQSEGFQHQEYSRDSVPRFIGAIPIPTSVSHRVNWCRIPTIQRTEQAPEAARTWSQKGHTHLLSILAASGLLGFRYREPSRSQTEDGFQNALIQTFDAAHGSGFGLGHASVGNPRHNALSTRSSHSQNTLHKGGTHHSRSFSSHSHSRQSLGQHHGLAG